MVDEHFGVNKTKWSIVIGLYGSDSMRGLEKSGIALRVKGPSGGGVRFEVLSQGRQTCLDKTNLSTIKLPVKETRTMGE